MKKHQDDHGPYGPRLTPKEALGPDREDWLVFGEYRLLVRRPKSTDQLLDHPDIHYAFAQDEYLPYWPELWPAARMLAEFLATSGTVPPGLQTTPQSSEAPSHRLKTWLRRDLHRLRRHGHGICRGQCRA
jgi:hypothetical protein